MSQTSNKIPENVREQATGHENNCSMHVLLRKIVLVIDNPKIPDATKKEMVSEFNKVWGSNGNADWNYIKNLIKSVKDPVRLEVLFGRVLRNMTGESKVMEPKSGVWPPLSAGNAYTVGKKFLIQVEGYSTHEVTDAEKSRVGTALSSSFQYDADNLSNMIRIENPLITCRLLDTDGHFVGEGTDPAAVVDHNKYYDNRPNYNGYFESLRPVIQEAIQKGIPVEQAMEQFEIEQGLRLPEGVRRTPRNVTKTDPLQSLEGFLSSDTAKTVQEMANKASEKIGQMIGVDSKLFGPIFAAIPKLFSGIISLLASGLPIFKQIAEMFKSFKKSMSSPTDALSAEDIEEFSANLETGAEAAEFAQYVAELEQSGKGSGMAQQLNQQVREELQRKKCISPDLWVKLIKQLKRNGLNDQADECLSAREQDLIDKFSENGFVKESEKYKDFRKAFVGADLAKAEEDLKRKILDSRLSAFKQYDSSYQKLADIWKKKQAVTENTEAFESVKSDLTDKKKEADNAKQTDESKKLADRLAQIEIELKHAHEHGSKLEAASKPAALLCTALDTMMGTHKQGLVEARAKFEKDKKDEAEKAAQQAAMARAAALGGAGP